MPTSVTADLDVLIDRTREELSTLERARGEIGETPTPRAKPGPKPGSKRKRRKQKRQGGTRAEHVVALIEKTPGLTATQVATELKLKPNYLYRVFGDLVKERLVNKEGRKYYPVPVALGEEAGEPLGS